jgi:hypothetical protein
MFWGTGYTSEVLQEAQVCVLDSIVRTVTLFAHAWLQFFPGVVRRQRMFLKIL